MVYVGLAFGGLALWSFFAGSLVVMVAVITRLGYASNFRNWDISLKRALGLPLGFVVAAGFFGGLNYLKTWFVPIAFMILGFGMFLVPRRSKS